MTLLVAGPVWQDPAAGSGRRRDPSAAAWGLVCGLAAWNSALALPALAGAGLGLFAAGLRPRPSTAASFAGGFALGVSPLLVARIVGASGSSPVTAIRPRWLWAAGLTDLGHAMTGLFGLEVPLVVDGPERAALPTALRVLLGMGLALTLAAALMNKPTLLLVRRLPLVGWAGGLAAAFAFSRRTGPDEVRYLFGLTVPSWPSRVRVPGLGRGERPRAVLGRGRRPLARRHSSRERGLARTRQALASGSAPPAGAVPLARVGFRSAYASCSSPAVMSSSTTRP